MDTDLGMTILILVLPFVLLGQKYDIYGYSRFRRQANEGSDELAVGQDIAKTMQAIEDLDVTSSQIGNGAQDRSNGNIDDYTQTTVQGLVIKNNTNNISEAQTNIKLGNGQNFLDVKSPIIVSIHSPDVPTDQNSPENRGLGYIIGFLKNITILFNPESNESTGNTFELMSTKIIQRALRSIENGSDDAITDDIKDMPSLSLFPAASGVNLSSLFDQSVGEQANMLLLQKIADSLSGIYQILTKLPQNMLSGTTLFGQPSGQPGDQSNPESSIGNFFGGLLKNISDSIGNVLNPPQKQPAGASWGSLFGQNDQDEAGNGINSLLKQIQESIANIFNFNQNTPTSTPFWDKLTSLGQSPSIAFPPTGGISNVFSNYATWIKQMQDDVGSFVSLVTNPFYQNMLSRLGIATSQPVPPINPPPTVL